MKILFFSSYFYPYTSGLTTYPFKILSHLSKKHQITVLTFNHFKNQCQEETVNKIRIIRLPYLFKISKGYISPQSIYFFIKFLKNTDLVFLNLPSVEGLPLILLSKLYQKNNLSLFHCFIYFKSLVLKPIEWLTNLITILQMFFSHKVIIYTKDYLKNFFIYSLINKKIVITLPPIKTYSIEKKMFKKFKQIKKNSIWVGYAGRLSSEKGLEYLIKAVSYIKNKKISLVFAGPYGKQVVGENNYYLKIKTLLKKNKVNYLFLGNLSENNLRAFYKIIDILVLPSINHTEAFGMVQAEAMVLGTPVIASNLPGVRVSIQLTKMGLLVKAKNNQQLTQAILKILNNKKNFTNQKLVNQAKKIFNINNVYRFYDNLIKKYEKRP